jgi:NAD(P)-dependent dehydrogenase (short-subunit alcohol dehydrogenase family)
MSDNKIAIVTGGGSGVGRTVALSLSEAGWVVIVAGRSADPLAQTAALAPNGRVNAMQADVTNEASVDALFDNVVAKHGRVDFLFNNAGINVPKVPLDELPVSKLREIVETNLIGSMLCARAAMRVMKAQRPSGGRIVNNGSVSAYAPRPNAAPYTATKHAITGLTKSLALDGRAAGIVCGQIDLGNIATDMTTYMTGAGALQPTGQMLSEPQFPIEEVGRAVCYMASLPHSANIPFMTLMASTMPLYGRG